LGSKKGLFTKRSRKRKEREISCLHSESGGKPVIIRKGRAQALTASTLAVGGRKAGRKVRTGGDGRRGVRDPQEGGTWWARTPDRGEIGGRSPAPN